MRVAVISNSHRRNFRVKVSPSCVPICHRVTYFASTLLTNKQILLHVFVQQAVFLISVSYILCLALIVAIFISSIKNATTYTFKICCTFNNVCLMCTDVTKDIGTSPGRVTAAPSVLCVHHHLKTSEGGQNKTDWKLNWSDSSKGCI